MPQCMNILDEINGLNYHTLKFKNNISIIDIYNDPKFYSLRNITLDLMYDALSHDFIDIEFKSKDNDKYIKIQNNMTISNITHIKFHLNEKAYLKNEKSLSISYRLIQKKRLIYLKHAFYHLTFAILILT